MARPRKNAVASAPATTVAQVDPPPAKVERTSESRAGIPNLTSNSEEGTPARAFKQEDYDWDANGEGAKEAAAGEKKDDPEADETPAAKEGEDPAAAAGDKPAADGKTPAADPPAEKMSDDLIKRAGDLGLPPAVARAFETPEALTKYLDAKAKAQTPQGEKGKDGVDNDSQFVFNADAFKDYPEEVQKTLAGMHKLITTQGEQLSAVRSELTKRTSSVELDIMDKAIDAIGDDKAFGKGATSGMAEGEPSTNRAKLIQAAQVLIAGREALGQPPLSMEQAFQKAYTLEFGERVAARANASMAQKVQRRVAQMVGRSESIPGIVAQQAALSPEQRAVQKGRELLAARGHTVGAQQNSTLANDGPWG